MRDTARRLLVLAAMAGLWMGAAVPLVAQAPGVSLVPVPRPAAPASVPVPAPRPVVGADMASPVPRPGAAISAETLPPVQGPPRVPPGIAALTGQIVAPVPQARTPGTAPPLSGPPDGPSPVAVVIVASELAPGASIRPATRPGAGPGPAAPPTATARLGPEGLAALAQRLRSLEEARNRGSELAVRQSLRPGLRPDGLERRVRAAATRATPARVAQPGQRGTLCGVPGLQGERLETFAGRSPGCGITNPVRLRSVDGVALSTPATINCTTAQALRTWLRNSAIPTVGRTGGGIASLRVVASYACRTRNSRRGARLSEHARGNAIDIAGIGLANGQELTVLGGWRDRRAGPLLQRMHRGACGPFGTVLGPNSDRFHQDHFHFDVASYRSGPYCR